ncbi:helix-turn-helix transcriptional regulator [Brachybacterium tyrofermentans]|uniref:helix-turn-helix transcriptional regulator n=1 Tax=Brachybacterium tyrofermentans TaxID=47848 RepID=UPI003F909D28
MNTKLMTKAETAEALRRTVKQLEWMQYTGNAPKSALIGGRRMFRVSDVEAWISEQFEVSA